MLCNEPASKISAIELDDVTKLDQPVYVILLIGATIKYAANLILYTDSHRK